MFRDIMSEVVIPEVFKDEVEPLIKSYNEERDYLSKQKAFLKILEYTFNFTIRSARDYKFLKGIKGLKGFYWVKGKYTEGGFIEEGKEDAII